MRLISLARPRARISIQGMDDDGHHYWHLSRERKNEEVAQAQGDRQSPMVPVERSRIVAGYIESPIALLNFGVTANVAGAATESPTGPWQGLRVFSCPTLSSVDPL